MMGVTVDMFACNEKMGVLSPVIVLGCFRTRLLAQELFLSPPGEGSPQESQANFGAPCRTRTYEAHYRRLGYSQDLLPLRRKGAL